MRFLQNPRFHLGLFTFNPYGVDIVKRITNPRSLLLSPQVKPGTTPIGVECE